MIGQEEREACQVVAKDVAQDASCGPWKTEEGNMMDWVTRCCKCGAYQTNECRLKSALYKLPEVS